MGILKDSMEMIIVSTSPLSFTDEEMLKQPLQTQVTLSTAELDDFHFEQGSHIHIPLRDFKVLPPNATVFTIGGSIPSRKPRRANPCNVLPSRKTLRRFLWPRTTRHNM